MSDHDESWTVPDEATRLEERVDAEVTPAAGAGPTPAEEEAADEAARELKADGTDRTVAEHYEEMIERGAHQEGEGRI